MRYGELRERLLRWRPSTAQRRAVVRFLVCGFAAALIALPLTAERAVERVTFEDNLGTFPVVVGLCHDGRSTLDTGLLGKIYFKQTGTFGFGAYARATGPPEAGGTLASYVDPTFIQTNVALIDDPDETVRAYASELSSGLRQHIARDELLAFLVGGAVLFAIVPRRRWAGVSPGRRVAVPLAMVVVASAVSGLVALEVFDAWDCSSPTGTEYTIPGVDRLAFGSSETREVAAQVEPFINKQTVRIERAGKAYEQRADRTFVAALATSATEITPRKGETMVIAEADPQGSFVGTRVRTTMYDALQTALGPDAISLRTIAGDVSSNGTVAEAGYIKAESEVGGEVPVAAAAGDHDSTRTWTQMTSNDITLPDLKTVDIDGIRVSAANDREHKTLFGGMVTNSSGISEQELGAKLRAAVDDQSQIVVLHQPDAVAGYLGLDNLDPVRALERSRTTPYDDGVPDQPPGIVDIGHLHKSDGPWVLWNTDGDELTWTVVDQLGTAGGVENAPTFSRFSTPLSAPLKELSVRLQYLNVESGLETGYATVTCALDGTCSISHRTEVGLPGGQPGRTADLMPLAKH